MRAIGFCGSDGESLLLAQRGWLNDTRQDRVRQRSTACHSSGLHYRSYVPPVKIGETMRAGGLGSVIAVGTAVKSLKLGDKVEGILGGSYVLMNRCLVLTAQYWQAGRSTLFCRKSIYRSESLRLGPTFQTFSVS